MKKGLVSCICLFLFLFVSNSTMMQAQQNLKIENSFTNSDLSLKTIGRGICSVKEGVLKSKDSYACFGNSDLRNYTIKFRARVPEYADQVQIWSGFRAFNRNDRYVLGLKGGLQNDLYLSRMGYMGTDEFLALRELDFQPQPGVWYDFKIEVCKNRIRVFLNNELFPRIDVIDPNSNLAPSGQVTLGGSWIETEFDDLVVTPIPDDYLKDVEMKEYIKEITFQEKESKRKLERAAYKPIVVDKLTNSRVEVSLDGQWLFMPEYQLSDEKKAVSEGSDDNWHVMTVPNFWNPIRIWLHGETMGAYPKGVSDTYYQKETNRCKDYTFDYKKIKAAWYRQWVDLPQDIASRKSVLKFDAVSKVAQVFVNGSLAGSHIGMFGDFQVDATSYLKPGRNLIVVKVVRDYIKVIEDANKIVDVAVTVPVTNKMLKDIAHGFYGDDPAGIWQPVSLIITNVIKIEDVFIKPSLTGAEFDVTIKNHSSKKAVVDIYTDIMEKATGNLFYKGDPVKKISLSPGEERVVTYSASDLKPRLWSPAQPNLYDFIFRLTSGSKNIDETVVCSGFRTFESKNGLLYLNGKPYWLRGGNHTPFALAPNDLQLANTFFQLMKAGNIDVTRTHTTPYNKLWMNAADRNGVGISFEGTWPWLMIQSSMPEKDLITMWADEYLSLLKKYRNHPSLLFWTVNNEMKFYDNEPDFAKAKNKMRIISDVVKQMRKIDPTRPICFDSNYKRNEKKFGKDFFTNIDDGDIDDIHAYINWYDHTLFKQFNGEFQKSNKNSGRPLISQEMSTGYPNNETGHATRFYNLIHQNPQALIGYQSYAFANPDAFLNVQSFITGELAEALRRSNDQGSGILHFALLTWFRNVYDARNIEPYPTYYALKRALQPVLVSAELWGRNFYAGEKLPVRICVVNDRVEGTDLAPSTIYWELVDNMGKKLSWGKESVSDVKYYTREWIIPDITLPPLLETKKSQIKLKLRLTENGIPLSENEYKIVLAEKEWSASAVCSSARIVLVDHNNMRPVFDFMKISYTAASSVTEALKQKANLYVFAGLDKENSTKEELLKIQSLVADGGKVLFLDSQEACKAIYPEYITGWIIPTEGDIVNMEMPESPVFDNIDLLELRYFNNNKREIPVACHLALQINRNKNVEELANQTKIHGYINGDMRERSEYVKKIKGFPLLKIKDKGTAIISTMSLEKATTDPIAGRLLTNIVNELLK